MKTKMYFKKCVKTDFQSFDSSPYRTDFDFNHFVSSPFF